nr:PREDICTED: tensin-3 [Anolis carolinensis]|eukprot:XP_003222271.2 PREDICTED: tensin-3 [Anolis carolinensis]
MPLDKAGLWRQRGFLPWLRREIPRRPCSRPDLVCREARARPDPALFSSRSAEASRGRMPRPERHSSLTRKEESPPPSSLPPFRPHIRRGVLRGGLSAMTASLDPQDYMEGLNHSVVVSDHPTSPDPALLMSDVQSSPSCQRPFKAACTFSSNSSILRRESPTHEHIWQQDTSTSSIMSQFSEMNHGKLLGSYSTSHEFTAPVQDGSLLCHFQNKGPPTGSLKSLKNSSADQQQNSEGNASIQDFLNFGSCSVNSSQSPLGKKQSAFLPRGNGSPKMSKSPVDSSFLTQSFLASTPRPNSQNSPNEQSQGVNMPPHPSLQEKRRTSEGDCSFRSISPSSGFSSPHSGSSIGIPFPDVLPDFSKVVSTSSLQGNTNDKHVTVKFVQDTSKFWYKPDISREQAIDVLKDKEAGSFVVRDSHSFRGAYGLAMKVATPPPSVLQLNKKVGDLSNELVRHFLIECTHKGVRLKGCPNEPYFGSLAALVYQHSITPLALPCKLLILDKDPLEEVSEMAPQTAANSATDLLKQGAACNVWYLNSVELESLTGYQAIQKALSLTLSQEPPPSFTVVHFKVSTQGITLTDNQRKLFFRRHYPVNTVIFCALDPQDRKWMKDGPSAKVFGFVARKQGSATDNVCHLFAQHDPEQPASAIVNFVSKVMIASQKKN